jgi:hypothetical protein
MTAAVITACASVVVAFLGYVLNRRGQQQLERRQALLDRVNRQLRDLYGPLNALVDVNEQIWAALRESRLPGREERRRGTPLTEDQRATWTTWINHALTPANRRMKDLIMAHADLVVQERMPDQLLAFCAHVTAYEVLLATGRPDETNHTALIQHPGQPYVDYVRSAFTDLKHEQVRLLRLTSPRGASPSYTSGQLGRDHLALRAVSRLVAWTRRR